MNFIQFITTDLKIKYSNIFELRFLKNKFLLEMKDKPNFILINYEELQSNTNQVLKISLTCSSRDQLLIE